jgi:hypothetical protein
MSLKKYHKINSSVFISIYNVKRHEKSGMSNCIKVSNLFSDFVHTILESEYEVWERKNDKV